jgi:hypothetical protein
MIPNKILSLSSPEPKKYTIPIQIMILSKGINLFADSGSVILIACKIPTINGVKIIAS